MLYIYMYIWLKEYDHHWQFYTDNEHKGSFQKLAAPDKNKTTKNIKLKNNNNTKNNYKIKIKTNVIHEMGEKAPKTIQSIPEVTLTSQLNNIKNAFI